MSGDAGKHIVWAPNKDYIANVSRQLLQELPGLSDKEGDGTGTVAYLLDNVLQTLKRQHRNELKEKGLLGVASREKGAVRISPKMKYGTIAFMPLTYGDGETEETQAEKQKWLKECFQRQGDDGDAQVVDYMSATYPSQRKHIVDRILHHSDHQQPFTREWPYLGQLPYLKLHFKLLTGVDMDARIAKNMHHVTECLLSYFTKEAGKARHGKYLTQDSVETCLKHCHNKTTEEQFVFLLYLSSSFMREMVDSLFVFLEADPSAPVEGIAEQASQMYYSQRSESQSTQSQNVTQSSDGEESNEQQVDDPDTSQKRVRLVVLGSDIYNSRGAYPMIDDHCLGTEPMSLFDALCATFALFYVHGRDYPYRNKGMLDFLQRKIFQLEGNGSKVERLAGQRNPANVSPNYKTFADRVRNHCELVKGVQF